MDSGHRDRIPETQTTTENQKIEGESKEQAPKEADATPPTWAFFKSAKAEPEDKLDDDDSHSTTTIAETPVPERTPSPIQPDSTPDNDNKVTMDADAQEEEVNRPQKAEVTPPPQPKVLKFTSVEDMKENLILEEKPLTNKQYNDLVVALAPTAPEKFKLMKQADSEHRWPAYKECIFVGSLVRVIGQDRFEEQER